MIVFPTGSSCALPKSLNLHISRLDVIVSLVRVAAALCVVFFLTTLSTISTTGGVARMAPSIDQSGSSNESIHEIKCHEGKTCN